MVCHYHSLMTNGTEMTPLKIWLPTVKTHTGTDVYTQMLTDQLRKRGHETHITWLPQRVEFFPFMASKTAPPFQPDIIQTNSWNGFAFKHPSAKTVTTIHHWVHDPLFSPYKSPLQRIYHQLLIKRFETLTIRSADCVLCVSHYTKLVANLEFGASMQVIANGIDTTIFHPAKSIRAEGKNSKLKVLYVGSNIRRKGTDILPKILAETQSDVDLRYISKQAIQDLPADNCTHLSNLSQEEIVKEYQQCDIFLFPSRYEGFGLSVAEAMATGACVIACDNSAIPELIKDGHTGFLCNTDDHIDFARKIDMLSVNRSLITETGKQAASFIQNNFTVENMIDAYIHLYRELNHK